MGKLDPKIEAVRAQYGLESSDFWQIPQNKQWVCKHAALEIVATKANVVWSAPQIIQADTGNGIAVLAVTGTMGDRSEWSTGEASPKNNKNAYPWAMAEKRAKDRVVLKLVGIHGLVYSEDEMPSDLRGNGNGGDGEKSRATKADSRETYERLSKANRALENLEHFNKFWSQRNVQAAFNSLPADWARELTIEKNDKAAELEERAELAGDDDFPGDSDQMEQKR